MILYLNKYTKVKMQYLQDGLCQKKFKMLQF